MGLDMRLNKKIYIGANYSFNKITGTIELKSNGVIIPIKFNKVKYILEEQACWENARHIHSWFIENVQNGIDDCGLYEIKGESILKLLNTCKKVIQNPELASELLPIENQEKYDKNYFKDIENTINQLQDIEAENWYEYSSSY